MWLRVHSYPTPLSSVTLRTVRLSVRLGSPVTEPTDLHYRLPTLSRSHCTAPHFCPAAAVSAQSSLGGDFKGYFVILMNAPPMWTLVHIGFLYLQGRFNTNSLDEMCINRCHQNNLNATIYIKNLHSDFDLKKNHYWNTYSICIALGVGLDWRNKARPTGTFPRLYWDGSKAKHLMINCDYILACH